MPGAPERKEKFKPALNHKLENKLKNFDIKITDDQIIIKFTLLFHSGGERVLVGGVSPTPNNISLALLILGSILIPISKRGTISIDIKEKPNLQEELLALNNALELGTNQSLKEQLDRIDNIIDNYINDTFNLTNKLREEGIILNSEELYILRK